MKKYIFLVIFTFTPRNLSLNKSTPPATFFCACEQTPLSFGCWCGHEWGQYKRLSLYPQIHVAFTPHQGNFSSVETTREIQNQSKCRVVELSAKGSIKCPHT